MPRFRVERYYYRSGQIHVENRYVNGEFHGCCRTGHFNGQLAEELRYDHGLLHGVCREWDESGRLLGSFTMNRGTGLQRYWHDSGRLRMEFHTFDGNFYGRSRHWLRDGTLVRERFAINNRDATRVAYLKAARKNLDWPQYEGELAGRVVRRAASLERKEYELFIASILEKSHAEAKAWLSGETPKEGRSLAKFRSTKSALRFVETLYVAGAATVFVAPIYGTRKNRLLIGF